MFLTIWGLLLKKLIVKPKNFKTMSIVRYNTLNDFVPTSFSNLIDRFFNESVSRSGGSSYSFVPRVDILENEKAFEIHMAVPGMNKEDFKLDVKDNLLTISGERKFTKEVKEDHFRSFETQYGTFSRSFSLPENVDGAQISAKYNNGILAITLPKDEKKVLKTTIKVN
jgi:HSP20 family protein